jgi:chromatin segregation and condensation protein Rec8/ScpA/Scc1 (kleisin family)
VRIRRLLAKASAGRSLAGLVPVAAADDPPVRRRSAWSSTFVASLELARLGEVALTQRDAFGPIHVSFISASPST